LFGAVPLIAAFFGRVSVWEGFALRAASLPGFLGAVILGLSLWPFAHELFLANRWLGLVSLDEEKLQPAIRLIEQLPQVPLWWIIAALAIAPAVFEEFFFRGYFFSAVQKHATAAQTIVLTAVLFGLFHVFSSVLAVERMLPSTLLGLVLGWVRWRTGSVLPGMLLHACHNGFLMTVAYYRDEIMARGWGLQEQSHLPALWLAAAGIATAVGLALVALARPRETSQAKA
jgi:ABC-2 type transport system permease protein/sodium transport system permease protein